MLAIVNHTSAATSSLQILIMNLCRNFDRSSLDCMLLIQLLSNKALNCSLKVPGRGSPPVNLDVLGCVPSASFSPMDSKKSIRQAALDLERMFSVALHMHSRDQLTESRHWRRIPTWKGLKCHTWTALSNAAFSAGYQDASWPTRAALPRHMRRAPATSGSQRRRPLQYSARSGT